MSPLGKPLACAALASAMCLAWSAPAAGQGRRPAPAKGGKSASGPAASRRLPPTPAAGGGSSTKTREEADALLAAGERYVDPNFPANAGRPAAGGRRLSPVEPESGDPSAAADLIAQADGLFDSGNYTEAFAAYQRAVSAYPRSAEAHLTLGMAYNAMGEYGSAFKPLVQALRLAPGSPEAQYGIGHAYVNVDKPREALPFLRAAVRLSPDHAEARYDLGVAYAMLNNKRAAIGEYVALKSLDPHLAGKLEEVINGQRY